MKLYLGLLESSRPDQTRIFTEIDGRLIDVNLAYAAYLQQSPNNPASAYELADFYFPETIAAFLERGEPARKALAEVTGIRAPRRRSSRSRRREDFLWRQ